MQKSKNILNKNFLLLKDQYLFSGIKNKVEEHKSKNPDAEIISLGIGDVTLPLVPSVLEAMQKAIADLGAKSTFKGYGPEQGHSFLREIISKSDYTKSTLQIKPDEIFVGDGIKSDIANFIDLFSTNCRVAMCSPVYPAYLDANILKGRAQTRRNGGYKGVEFLECVEEQNFVPSLPKTKPNIIYLCYPNNPTGSMLTHKELKQWVDYALRSGAIILYDAAYEAYITGDFPRSIYEIEGAERCAVEFKSFSKTAGFTGVRCGYTVVPKQINMGYQNLNDMWKRRQSTMFNGASYVSQCGAAAIYTPQGAEQVKKNIDYYMKNAKYIKKSLKNAGARLWGGENAPYIWIKTPANTTSQEMFDIMLQKAGVVCTPGNGFGSAGEGYIRLTAFNDFENTKKAMKKIIDAKIF